MTNLEVVEQLAATLNAGDLDARDALLDDDVVQTFPQSGERFRGRANLRAIIERYPSGQPTLARLTDFFGAPFEAPEWRAPYREAGG